MNTVTLLLLASLNLANGNGDQVPQLIHTYVGGSGGLYQGSGDALADEEIVRGDTDGLQGSTCSLTDVGVLTCASGQLNLDNLRLDGNTFSTTNANGDLLLDPNGTGVISGGTATAPVRMDLYGVRTDASNYLRIGMDAGTTYGSFELRAAGTEVGARVLYIANTVANDGANMEFQTRGVARFTITGTGMPVWAAQSVTCSDSGDANPGALTLLPSLGLIYLTNSDANGCTVTMSETSQTAGSAIQIIVVSNAGGTVDFADTSGVSELAGAYTMDLYDTLRLAYIADRWVETSRSNN